MTKLIVPKDQLRLIIMNAFLAGKSVERSGENLSSVEYGKMYMEKYVEDFEECD